MANVAMGKVTEKDTVKVQEVGVPSSVRDAKIPAYITMPKDYDAKNSYPFVIMLHGHGGNHNEWGGYDAISDGLAEKGFIVATLDYSGCGASTESFKLNTMTNMKQDSLDVMEYVKSAYHVDKKRIGGFGYSMGGRLILELIAEKKANFACIDLVAPAEDLEDLKGLFGGHDSYDKLKATANKEGYVDFTSIYSTLPLSKEWFADLEKYSDNLVELAAKNYKKPSQVIWAVDDTTVHPAVSEHVAKVLGSKVLNTQCDGHSYSFYAKTPETVKTVNGGSIDWFVANLK
jgi:pimeloyl-ACP methyl ester carboxylesterase